MKFIYLGFTDHFYREMYNVFFPEYNLLDLSNLVYIVYQCHDICLMQMLLKYFGLNITLIALPPKKKHTIPADVLPNDGEDLSNMTAWYENKHLKNSGLLAPLLTSIHVFPGYMIH